MAIKTKILLAALIGLASVFGARAASDGKTDIVPRCNELTYEKSLELHPDAFSAVKFEVAFDDYRGWIKKKIKNYVSLAKRGHARKRKRNAATITVQTKSGLSCTLRAEIRAHGDLEDHYPSDMNEEPSLNISLVDGHLFGITKFILFRPETRYGENEVFAATLLDQMGFLSPRTTMASMSLAGDEKPPVKVIFQEKIVKEFLEVNHFREGPIIEGDERFAFGQRYAHLKKGAALGRVSNYKWARKGPTSMEIAGRALAQFNNLLVQYDKSFATIYGSNMVDIVEMARRLDAVEKQPTFVDYPVFEAIIFSMAGTHGFSQDDRRGVYDPLSNSFSPIYYDGGSSILTKPGAKLDRNITLSAQKAVPDALTLLDGLDYDALRTTLSKRHVDFSLEQLRTIVVVMKNRLGEMAISDEVEPVEIKTRKLYKRPGNRLSYVFTTENSGQVEVCKDSLTLCRLVTLDNKARAALLAQIWVDPEGFPAIYFAFPKSQLSEKYSSSSGEQETSLLNGLRPAIYSGLRKSELDREITLTINPQGSKSAHRTLELTDFQLDLYGEVEENVDEANRRIYFKRTGASGRAVVSNGKIEGWSLQFDDVSGHVKDVSGGEQNFDRNGLTGCLTIIDAQLRDLNFSVNNATCEDAINFVRVNGNVKSGSIKVTAFDAVDADFSQLKFDQLSVEKAGNDCLDLSYGDYQASNLQLIECGDKAISVGETSKASIKNLYARDVEIGLAAKDYGTILVDVAKIENSRKCYDLYNKKQEFSGGLLQINASSLDCGGAVGNVGPTSLVRGNIGY